MSADRGSVWKQFGAPVDQVGSVNEPRTCSEYGVVWNEKWIYRSRDGLSVVRVVLWNRYDLAGVFAIREDGSAEPERLFGTEDLPRPEGLANSEPTT